MAKAKIVWVICTDSDGCVVNAVCMNKEYAEQWVKKQNEKLGFEAYWVEQSQLLFNK